MKKWLTFGIAGLLVIGVLALMYPGNAFAQEDTPESELPVKWFGRGPGFGRGLHDQASLDAAAEALGMTADELSDQLWGGKTLADLAEEKGVALSDVRAAVETAQKTAFRDSIAQAVEEGVITQEHADWLLEGLDKGFLDGLGRGGLRGFHKGGLRDHSGTTETTP
jgi:hypothetical protein